MSEELLLLLVEVWALLMYRLSSFIWQGGTDRLVTTAQTLPTSTHCRDFRGSVNPLFPHPYVHSGLYGQCECEVSGAESQRARPLRLAGRLLYLAPRQLGQEGLQLLTNHRVDGHQAEDTGLAHAALCVVIALHTHTHSYSTTLSETLPKARGSKTYLQTLPGIVLY